MKYASNIDRMITIHIPGVSERDIDLLLLEEAVASTAFCTWFLREVGIHITASLSDARRSVRTETGESDLVLTFHSEAGAILALVENKVDAAFQLNQPQRYIERANGYRETGRYGQVITVLMAPQIYFGDEDENYGFDAKISYEAVLRWFSAGERKEPRTEYKLKLLQGAIKRGRSGWQLVPHAEVSRFWQSYWQLAMALAPQLSMPRPKQSIPAGSHFIVFRPAALPPNVTLKHKVAYGHVDLEFQNMGDRLAELYHSYQPVPCRRPPAVARPRARGNRCHRKPLPDRDPCSYRQVSWPSIGCSSRS